MNKAYKFRIYPNESQKIFINKTIELLTKKPIGFSRWVVHIN